MLGQLDYRPITLEGRQCHLRLEGGVWFRRARLPIVSPVHGHYRRLQAETPLNDLF